MERSLSKAGPRIELRLWRLAEREDTGGQGADSIDIQDHEDDGRTAFLEKTLRRYTKLQRLILACHRGGDKKEVPAATAVEKLARMYLWEKNGYPGEQEEPKARPVYIPKLAACVGVSRNAAAIALGNLVEHGLFRREDDWARTEDGQTKRIAQFAPVRELGLNEKLVTSARHVADRKRAAVHRACRDCGSEDVVVQPKLVRMERVTCRDCGGVYELEPPALRKFLRGGPAYEKRERAHERAAYLAAAADEAAEPTVIAPNPCSYTTQGAGGVIAPNPCNHPRPAATETRQPPKRPAHLQPLVHTYPWYQAEAPP